MKKLTLNLEALQVDSFSTQADYLSDAGTVQGHISGRVLCGPIEPGPPFERSVIQSCGEPCQIPSFVFCTFDESCVGACPVSARCPTQRECSQFICPAQTVVNCTTDTK